MNNHFLKSFQRLKWHFATILLVGIGFLHPVSAMAKTSLEDSLTALLPSLPEGEDRADKLIRLGDLLMRKDLEKALDYLNEALELSEKLDYVLGLTKTYTSLTIAYTEHGAYSQALEYGQKCIDYALQTDDGFRIGNAYTNVGNIHFYLENPDKALKYYQLGLEAYKSTDDKTRLAISYLNIGGIYREKKMVDSAFTLYQKSLDYLHQLESPWYYGEAAVLGNIGLLLLEDDKPAMSLSYIRDAKAKARKAEDPIQVVLHTMNEANSYIILEDFKKAKFLLDSAAKEIPLLKIPQYEAELQKNWALFYEEKGDYKQSLEYLKSYQELKDSLFSEEQQNSIDQIETVFGLERKNAQINLLEHERVMLEERASRRKWFSILLGGGLLFAILLIMVAILSARKQRRLNEMLSRKNSLIEEQKNSLESRNEELSIANREKDGLIQIVAHDLKTPVNNTLSLLTLLQKEEKLSPFAASVTQKIEVANRRAQHLIRDLLDVNKIESDQGTEEKSSFEIVAFAREQLELFRETANAKQIELRFEAPEYLPVRTHEDSLARILDNLISNAIKFSHPDSPVTLKIWQEAEWVSISVKDEGQGIPEKEKSSVFQKFTRLSARPTAGEDSTGLGLSIVKALSERLNGRVSFTSEWGKGSEFIVRIPRS